VLEGTGPWAGYELAVTRALGHKCMEGYGVIDICVGGISGSGHFRVQALVRLQLVVERGWSRDGVLFPTRPEVCVTVCMHCSSRLCNMRVQVIASDGLWDVLSPKEAVLQAMTARRAGKCAATAAQELVQRAIATSADQGEEQDNTTAVVVFFGPTPKGCAQPAVLQHTPPKKDASCTRFAPPS
jgi:serine/threonine protein phosphatase PrpC